MINYEKLFENNRNWVAAKLAGDKDYFTNLAKDQNPEFLYIGCSDSRVPANAIIGVEPGKMFVHRNIANLVCNTDLNVMSVINYAVEHLQVERIIVCGHYNCGGVKAAMESEDLGILNPWLRNIRDVYRLHKIELDGISDSEKRYRRLVELNVTEQCINIIKTAEVQEAYVERGFPTVHGWVFDIHTGVIKDLNLNFADILHEIQEIYNLTDRILFKKSQKHG